ncbi:MAG: accessory gene regulator ArgB-like protein [Anaeroplasmataceae bacterium]
MKLLARKITLFFINKGEINKEDLDVYEYCFEMLFSTLINFIILIIGALITKRYYETFVFAIAFIVIRRCIGGYHSKTHFGCIGLLVFMYIAMNLILLINYRILNILSIAISLLCLILISIFAPVGHPNNPIDVRKKEKMNAIAVLIASLYCLICIFTFLFIPKLNFSILITLPQLFSTISMIVGFLTYKNASYDKKTASCDNYIV